MFPIKGNILISFQCEFLMNIFPSTILLAGMELVIYRGENNRVYVLDPYCPHNGGHLGVGGRVVGNCLECPFHAWTFRGEDGKCVNIPYMDKSAKSESIITVRLEFGRCLFVELRFYYNSYCYCCFSCC